MRIASVTLPLPDGGEVDAQRAVRWQTYQLEERGERTIGLSLHDQDGKGIIMSFSFKELMAFQTHLNKRAMEIDPRGKGKTRCN